MALGDRRLLRLLPPGRMLVAIGQRRETAADRRATPRARPGRAPDLRQGGIRPPRIDKDKATGALKPPLRVTGSGTYPETVADRISDLIFQYRHGMYGWFWATAASTLLIGFIAGRRRFFQDIPEPPAAHPQDHMVVRRDRPGRWPLPSPPACWRPAAGAGSTPSPR